MAQYGLKLGYLLSSLLLAVALAVCFLVVVQPTQAQEEPQANLSLYKGAGILEENRFVVGEISAYRLRYTNYDATATATNVVIMDTLPANTRFVEVHGPTGPADFCTPVGNVLTCDLPDLPADSESGIDILVCPIAPGPAPNTATITSDTPDRDLSDNTATVEPIVTTGPIWPGFECSVQPPPPTLTKEACKNNPGYAALGYKNQGRCIKAAKTSK